MAVSNVQARDFKGSTLQRDWHNAGAGYTLSAGYGGSSGYWYTQIKFTSDVAFSTVSIVLYAGSTENTNASHQLRWGISSSDTEQLSNIPASEAGVVCGNIRFINGSYSAHTFTSGTIGPYAPGTYYITIWSGSGPSYGDYSNILSLPNYYMSVSTNTVTTYTISYNANGGSGAPSSQTKYNGISITLSSTKPTRTGHTFQGWATSSTGSVAYAAGASYTANASVTLYAVWKANTYTITFNANGGSGAPAAQTKTYGVTLTLSSTKPSKSSSSSSSNFTITGNANGGVSNSTATATKTTTTTYPFSHWNTKADGSGTSYNAGASFTSNATTTLYAIYSTSTSNSYTNNTLAALSAPTRNKSIVDGFTVTFNPNGGECATTSLTAKNTTNYSFSGWGSAANSTSVLSNTTAYTQATTVYAVWGQTTQQGSITLPTPTRAGYKFLGWGSQTALSGVTGAYTPTSNTTLYAIWQSLGPFDKQPVVYIRINGQWQMTNFKVYEDGMIDTLLFIQ